MKVSELLVKQIFIVLGGDLFISVGLMQAVIQGGMLLK